MDTSAYELVAGDGLGRRVPPAVSQAVIEEVLTAFRTDRLDEWMRTRRRLSDWMQAHVLGPVFGAAGDVLARHPAARAAATGWALRWAIAQLRPDRADAEAPIPRDAWIDRTSWRPMLALWCQYGFGPVQAFPDRYRGHADEPAASHLCGLWSVGPSTYYRYLDKGKRGLAALLQQLPFPPDASLALRNAARGQALHLAGLKTDTERRAWHRAQARTAAAARDHVCALWHQRHAGDVVAFIRMLERHSVELAAAAETDLIVEQLAIEASQPRQRFDLALARAGLARMRGDADTEQRFYEHALRVAAEHDDALMLGIAYGALGKFHEPRDPHRAFACYQDSVEQLWRSGVGDDTSAPSEVLEEYASTLVRLAWLNVLRGDPRARSVLERVDELRARHALSPQVLAMAEQTWGELCRRTGDLDRAIEHKHRALNLYERLDDQQAILKTCSNLSLIYGEAKDHARAIDYAQRVLRLAHSMAVGPEILAATHMNLGVAHFWQGDYASARAEYLQALDIGLRSQLHWVAGKAHYNLAEAAYLRFKQTGSSADELEGDRHAAAAVAVWPHESDPTHTEATRKLKQDILGPGPERARDRLLPAEQAAHYAEMAEVQRQREVLAVPVAPEAHVRAHLAIANAYLAISVKEREAALALIERHHLGDRFAAELDTLRRTFDRELTREQRLAATWERATSDLLNAQRCGAVLAQLLRAGSINKSGYGELCALSPATASKHLGMLAERGLLVQTGKGPATRYLLASDG
jgi:tetratricopeptide (TPR) repeat protein